MLDMRMSNIPKKAYLDEASLGAFFIEHLSGLGDGKNDALHSWSQHHLGNVTAVKRRRNRDYNIKLLENETFSSCLCKDPEQLSFPHFSLKLDSSGGCVCGKVTVA